ncbi:hypothetical protein HGRIS_004211 [Hohenbuehelia grisea]|uniref:Uncharacterized protein n=1 Tax=Hohenbuehelia grisea TaxID=104357 RepID=A0ABR3JIF8_9AGAR
MQMTRRFQPQDAHLMIDIHDASEVEFCDHTGIRFSGRWAKAFLQYGDVIITKVLQEARYNEYAPPRFMLRPVSRPVSRVLVR